MPAGEIRLFHGRHTGPNRGFGAEHIWAEHEREMVAAGFPAVVILIAIVQLAYARSMATKGALR